MREGLSLTGRRFTPRCQNDDTYLRAVPNSRRTTSIPQLHLPSTLLSPFIHELADPERLLLPTTVYTSIYAQTFSPLALSLRLGTMSIHP
ncbi:hypothetical protein AHAS_Ahas03G0023800 [Arachis hypogaea]